MTAPAVWKQALVVSVLIFVTPTPNDNFSLAFLLTFMWRIFSLLSHELANARSKIMKFKLVQNALIIAS